MSALISIVIPTKNSAQFLGQCLSSIRQQNFQEFEVIVIDGNSTDNTLQLLQTCPNLRLLKQVGQGLGSAWNEGINASTAEYIAFLDSDDWWESNCLSLHMKALLGDKALEYSIGEVKYFSDDPTNLPYGFKPSLLKGTHSALMPGCFVGKRSLFKKIGLFDETLSVATDLQWFHDLKLSGFAMAKLQEHVLNKRVHSCNLSYTSSKTTMYNNELLKVIHRRLKANQCPAR